MAACRLAAMPMSFWLPLLYAIVAVTVQVLVPPIVGVADNGDFHRNYQPFGLEPLAPDDPPRWLSRTYGQGRTLLVHGIGSEWVMVPLALVLNWTFHGRTFDITSLGTVHGAAFLVALGLLLALLHRTALRPASRLVIGMAVTVAACDVSNVAAFNSFGTEQTTLIAFMFLVAGLLAVALEGRATGAGVAWVTAAGILYVISKPQLAPSALFVAAAVLRLRWLAATASVREAVPALAVLVLAAGAGSQLQTQVALRHIVTVNVYHAVFTGVLQQSPDPAADLRELGADPALVGNVGVQAWGDPRSPDFADPKWRAFLKRVRLGTVVRFYLSHPSRLVALLDAMAVASLGHPKFWTGNYERASGKPAFAHPETWDAWARVRHALPASLTTVGGFVVVAVALAALVHLRSGRRGQLLAEVFVLVAALGASQFVLVPVGSGLPDLARHAYPFTIAFDAMVFFSIAALWAMGERVAARARA